MRDVVPPYNVSTDWRLDCWRGRPHVGHYALVRDEAEFVLRTGLGQHTEVGLRSRRALDRVNYDVSNRVVGQGATGQVDQNAGRNRTTQFTTLGSELAGT